VYTYQVFNAETGLFVAAVLPALEFVTGTSLVVGMFRRPAAMTAAALFLCFAGVRTWVVANGLDVSCGCFGVSGEDSVTWLDVATSLLLFSVTLVLAFQSIRTGTSTSIESQARNEAGKRLGGMPQRGAESVSPAI
jgi:hypothetical protein